MRIERRGYQLIVGPGGGLIEKIVEEVVRDVGWPEDGRQEVVREEVVREEVVFDIEWPEDGRQEVTGQEVDGQEVGGQEVDSQEGNDRLALRRDVRADGLEAQPAVAVAFQLQLEIAAGKLVHRAVGVEEVDEPRVLR